MNIRIQCALRGVVAVAIAAVIAAGGVGCAPYFATRVPFSSTMEQTTDAVRKTAFNLPDIELIADKGNVVEAGEPEARYVGMRSKASAVRGVRSEPVLGVRVSPQGTGTVVRLNSSGDEREADIFAVALEQELADENAIPKDSLPLPIFPMQPKSSLIQQGLNFLNPGVGLWYVLNDNPYYSPEWWKPALIGAADIGALALGIPAALHVIQGNASRSQQYHFILGLAAAAALRYSFGMEGFAIMLEYNELSETPYYLGASYVRSRISSIGVSVRLP